MTGLKTQLQGYLERLQQPVEILASLDDERRRRVRCSSCSNDIAALSPLVTLEAGATTREIKPSFALRRIGEEAARAIRGRPHRPRVHLAGARLAAGGWPSPESRADGHSIRCARSKGICASRLSSR